MIFFKKCIGQQYQQVRRDGRDNWRMVRLQVSNRVYYRAGLYRVNVRFEAFNSTVSRD